MKMGKVESCHGVMVGQILEGAKKHVSDLQTPEKTGVNPGATLPETGKTFSMKENLGTQKNLFWRKREGEYLHW